MLLPAMALVMVRTQAPLQGFIKIKSIVDFEIMVF